MYRWVVMILLINTSMASASLLGDSSCLPWTYRPSATSPCECGSSVDGAIECNITTGVLNLLMCFSVTNDLFSNKSIAGYCPYSCIVNFREPRYQLHMTRENFTHSTCGVWKRQGPLCSQCINNHGFPLYSYKLECVNCKSNSQIKEVSRFLAVSLIPLTVLCIVVTVFHLSVLRPPWSMFVLAAQILSSPLIMQFHFNDLKMKQDPKVFIKQQFMVHGILISFGPSILQYVSVLTLLIFKHFLLMDFLGFPITLT